MIHHNPERCRIAATPPHSMSPTSTTFAGSSGQEAAAWTARPVVVGTTLIKQTPVLAALIGVPAIAAVVEQEARLAIALCLPTLALAIAGAWSRTLPPGEDLRRIEAVATLALVFIIAAILTLPAFMMLGMRPLDALFEGVSGITTTGLSVATNAADWPISGHFLRAWVHWCGGIVIAVAGVALLMGASRAAMVLGRESLGDSDYLASTRAKARVILQGYTALTLVAIVGCTLLIPGWWEGTMIALAAVSTGGFSPRDSSLADYSVAAQAFTMLMCVAGAVSMLFYAMVLRRGLGPALRNGTVPATLAIAVAGTLIYSVTVGFTQGWDSARLMQSALNFLSAQSTAGFSVAPVISAAGPAIVIMMVAMVIGGDVGSTTGGIKTGRVITLALMIRQVLLRLRLPDSAVSHLKIGGERADADQIIFATALAGVYALSVMVFWMLLLIGGHPALPSLFDAISALSGVGHSSGVIGPDLAPWLKVATIVAMLLGRLEFFALIILFLPSTWISRR